MLYSGFDPIMKIDYNMYALMVLTIARNSEPLPPAKRDETLPYALFLFIGKCM